MHVCAWFSSLQLQMGVFVNGSRLGNNVSYSLGPIQGGGDLVIGQEQDDVNVGGLDSDQAFR